MMYISDYIAKIAPYLYEKYGVNPKIDVVLYGAGEKAKLFLADYHNHVNVIGICDDDENKDGTFLDEIPIHSFSALKDKIHEYPVFITSKWSDGIAAKLKENKIQHVYHRFAMDYLLHVNELQMVFDMLTDDLSRKVMIGLIEYIFTQEPEIFKTITPSEEQYFLKDIFEFHETEYVVDGGAFTGDTLLSFLQSVPCHLGGYDCFEPDEHNFTVLQETVEGLAMKNKITCHQMGLFSKQTTLGFSNSHSSASCISSFADDVVEVDSIDNVLAGKPVTFIKMDIEGAEYEGLLGAKNTIVQQKPNLAICIYHLASDLWKLPLLIKEIAPEYQLYMRHHNKGCWYESVLYARKQ